MYWSVIEVNVGILASSIPSYKALVKTYFPLLLGNTYSGAAGDAAIGGKGYSDTYSLDRMKGGATNTTTVTGGHSHLGSISGSEEQMVCPAGMIIRTTAVVVDESHSARDPPHSPQDYKTSD